MVPETGIEPVRPLRKREILSLLCLPISPLGQCLCMYLDFTLAAYMTYFWSILTLQFFELH